MVSPFLISSLLESHDMFRIPLRLVSSLNSKDTNWQAVVTMIVRAAVLGFLLAMLSEVCKAAHNHFERACSPAYFSRPSPLPNLLHPSSDPAYPCIMTWVAQDPYARSQIHNFELSTRKYKSSGKATAAFPFIGGGITAEDADDQARALFAQFPPLEDLGPAEPAILDHVVHEEEAAQCNVNGAKGAVHSQEELDPLASEFLEAVLPSAPNEEGSMAKKSR
ncbi:hypothetical protein IAU60_002163 [Kwoniella sp. DSM 27419]